MNVRETKSSSTFPPTTTQPPITQNESQEVILDIEKVGSGEGECRRVESEQTLCDKSGVVSPKTENCFPYSQKSSGGLREHNIEEDSGRQSLREDEQEQPSTTGNVREASSDIFHCQLSQPQAMDVELGSEPEREAVQWIDRHSSFFRLCFITCCCATQLIVQGQLGLTMIPLHYIGDYLGTTENGQLSWMVASYGLTIGMFLVASGRLGDLYGPKLMWTLGFIVMISANLGTGFCKGPIPFDICRALAGVGSAMSLPNALAILGRTYPPGKIRNITFAILGALAPAGYCIGGGVASLFAQFVDVRWIWWFVIHDIRGYTLPLTMTAQTSPFFFGGIVAALSVPFLIHRLPGHVIFFTAMCAFMIGNILAATAPVGGIYWGNTFFSILIGVFGADLSFPTGQLIVSNSVDVEFQGIAAGVVSMITNYSQSIGLGLAGTIERYVRGPDNLSRSDLLYGYRVSFYFAIALSALAVIVVGLFVRMPTEGKRLDDEREKAEHQ
ncbi:hypothetical protein D1P53_005651 [Cryptococcus gattii VGV]|nr:hypothetical protein D1P53_005651 [Cryptococcus gattii VGV]